MSSIDVTASTTTLTIFAESGLRSILTATTPPAFSLAFDAFFSRFLEATLNGKTMSRAEFKLALLDVQRNARESTVDFSGAVQASKSGEKPDAVSLLQTGSRCLLSHRR